MIPKNVIVNINDNEDKQKLNSMKEKLSFLMTKESKSDKEFEMVQTLEKDIEEFEIYLSCFGEFEIEGESLREYNKLQDLYNNEKENIIKSEIKKETYRRIRAILPEWMVEREITGGEKIPESVKSEASRLRAISNDLEASLVEDYNDNKYWQ